MKYFIAIILQLIACQMCVYAADSTSIRQVDITAVSIMPIGTVIIWTSATNPKDMDRWLECNGQAVPASYSELRSVVGAYVPDYRGMFLRGNGGNSAALGVEQGYAMRDVSSSGWITTTWGGQISGSGIFKYIGGHGLTVVRGSWDGA